ncbi:MAG TPA: peptidoglycan-binding domain-containing protein [Clostridia bacterium]|nr:peptidoglycan-binding domain-containing protein [Clostridia bacterium]
MTWLLLAGLMVGLLGALPAAQAEVTFRTYTAANSFPGSFTRNLYKGCTGSDVRVLQRLLKDLGYYTGAVDGIFGSNTRTAVQNFQRRNGLGVDGVAGKNTFRILLGGDAVGPSGSGGSSGGSSGHLPAGRTYLQFGDENEQVLAITPVRCPDISERKPVRRSGTSKAATASQWTAWPAESPWA